MENKFKKGIILGGILTTAAFIGIAMARKKTELDEDIQADFKILVKIIKKNLSKLEDITQDKYNEIVEEAVAKYSEKKEMVKEAQKRLLEVLREKWNEAEEESIKIIEEK